MHRHKQLNISNAYAQARDVLKRGGVVAMPTDTVYGLVAIATDDAAVRLLYEIKRRPPDQALPLFVGSLEQARLIVEWNADAEALAAAFWPGALTIVLRRRPTFATLAAAGGDTLAVRAPGDPLLRELALDLGPLTGTSANRSTMPPHIRAEDVRAELGDDVDYIVDAQIAASGVASTIVDCTRTGHASVVREGGVSREQIAAALPRGSTLG